jgi:Ca2+-binding EF-hand superfamily protein
MIIMTMAPIALVALLPLFAYYLKYRDDYFFNKKYEDMMESMHLPNDDVDKDIKGGRVGGNKIDPFELDKLRKCFVYFDKDGSGSFTLDELLETMRELRLNPQEEEIKGLVDEADENGDGEITFQEFAAVMRLIYCLSLLLAF